MTKAGTERGACNIRRTTYGIAVAPPPGAPMNARLLLLVASSTLAACTMVRTRVLGIAPDGSDAGAGTGTTTTGSAPATIDAPDLPPDAFTTLRSPADAHAELCAPDAQHPAFPNDADQLTMVFCQDAVPGGVVPTPHGLADLLSLLGLAFADPAGQNGEGGNTAFAILGHSSALTARRVTSITPTTFIFTPPPAGGGAPQGRYALLAFDPGELFVEVAVNDPPTGDLNFYLVQFDKDCVSAPGGCTNVDLLTPSLVTGWSNVRIYEMSTLLDDTIFDCHVCHQPVDANAPFLRMQEIEAPFTHWFSAQTTGGQALLSDFHAAHGNSEDYGGIPAAMIDQSDPAKLAAFITAAGFGSQPNGFASAAIEQEVSAFAQGQPATNVPPGQSTTWQALYEAAAGGQFIAAPYHDVKITDPDKLAHMTSAYQSWQGGALTDLPDLRDVFLDDGLRDMGFAPPDGADGAAMLVQMCQECHNANLDMTLTREKFLVDQLGQMSRDEKDLAIQRLQLDTSTRLRMPPPLFRTITDDERAAMIAELQK
ncbi:MAG: hypothetical protein ACRELB_20770 [Polyangiaceae bacterium]